MYVRRSDRVLSVNGTFSAVFRKNGTPAFRFTDTRLRRDDNRPADDEEDDSLGIIEKYKSIS